MNGKKVILYKDGEEVGHIAELPWFFQKMLDPNGNGIPDAWEQEANRDPSIEIKKVVGDTLVTVTPARDTVSKQSATPRSHQTPHVPLGQSTYHTKPTTTTPMSPTDKQHIGNLFRMILLIAGLWFLAKVFLF